MPGSDSPSSSPRKPSSGRRSRSSSRIARCERVGLADEVGRRALARDLALGAVARALSSSAAGHPRGLDAAQQLEQLALARAPPSRRPRSRRVGRARLRPRALGLELGGERQQRRLVVRAADELHAARQPVGAEAGRDRRGRLAGDVPRRRCRAPSPATALSVHSAPRPSQLADPRRRRCGRRRQQHVVVVEDAVQRARAYSRLAGERPLEQRAGLSAPSRAIPACAAPGARGARSRARRRGRRAGSAGSAPSPRRCRSRGRARSARARASAAARPSRSSARAPSSSSLRQHARRDRRVE